MSSNDTPYNPAEETINSILTGLLPVLIFGLFNGFEDDKKKTISMINIFDDFVIFASITIYPLITVLEWYQYNNTEFSKIYLIIYYIILAIDGIISYSFFLFIRYKSENLHKFSLFIRSKIGLKENENNEQKNEEKKKKIEEERNDETSISMDEENENKDNEGENNEDGNSIQHEEKKISNQHILNIHKSLLSEMLVIFFFMIPTVISMLGYNNFIGDFEGNDSLTSLDKNNYCTKNFGVNKCKSLRITNYIVYYCSIGFHFLQLIYIKYYTRKRLLKLQKRENKILRWFTSVLKHINIIILIVYPAIVSGYLISTNPITTKIAFGICTISFTRLVNHFNEKPENVNTLISFYLNSDNINNYTDKEQIEKDIEDLTKKLNDKIGDLKELKKGDGRTKDEKEYILNILNNLL
ncbi:hypothetical protein RhiirA1_452843 [Rhizophagus irregularis]|uniref:Uncharacterized protein n=1 Tax=Rhizophagus irregularis TaxID=588596 RepID=A0A2N0S8Y1_9GLOM|nr:hypothetical protein RhiirA1_452843 [Rhizophagus irregularis]CAB4476386.1 unnamed protein product [Rhizophagus irregularis]